jgi:hypothetical protein
MSLHAIVVRLGLALCLAAPLSACATAPDPNDQTLSQTADERLLDLRTTHRQLSEDPNASFAARDLDMARAWMDRAVVISADEDHDPEALTLLLRVIEGQLVQIQTSYANRAAQQRLEGVRTTYERRMKTIQAQRESNGASLTEPQEVRP